MCSLASRVEAGCGYHRPGQHLVVDGAEEVRRNVFCAVLAWSRVRFVRFGPDQTRATTLALLQLNAVVGRFATLADVVNHYDRQFGLHLSAQEKSDLVEYLKSL